LDENPLGTLSIVVTLFALITIEATTSNVTFVAFYVIKTHLETFLFPFT
jgi:hypothetical protein